MIPIIRLVVVVGQLHPPKRPTVQPCKGTQKPTTTNDYDDGEDDDDDDGDAIRDE